jgi:hypothetical protein
MLPVDEWLRVCTAPRNLDGHDPTEWIETLNEEDQPVDSEVVPAWVEQESRRRRGNHHCAISSTEARAHSRMV